MPIHSHDLYELELLKHVETDNKVTNRLVAQKLNVSVRLAHDILKNMVEKGLLHVKVVHSRRWDYFLTPKGMIEKGRLTMEYFDFSMYFYREARKRSAQVCRDLSEGGTTRIGFMGSGDLAEITYLGVQEWNLNLVAVFDDRADKTQFLNIPIVPLEKIGTFDISAIIVCMYDKKAPMGKHYLPTGTVKKDNFFWIF